MEKREIKGRVGWSYWQSKGLLAYNLKKTVVRTPLTVVLYSHSPSFNYRDRLCPISTVDSSTTDQSSSERGSISQ